MKTNQPTLRVACLLCALMFGFETYSHPNSPETTLNSVSETSLSGFVYEYHSGPSTPQSFSVADDLLLTRPYTITAPSGYEVSTEVATGYASSITIPGALIALGDITVYVRLTSNLPIATYNGVITITAPEITEASTTYPAVSETIDVSGEVIRRETEWTGISWSNGIPDTDASAIINDDYNTAINGNITAWDLLVTPENQLIIGNESFAKIQTNVTVNGDLTVEAKGAFVQVDDNGTFTLNTGGASKVIKYTTPLNHWYDYTYWSSPVNSATADEALANANPSRRYWYDAENYLDVLAETDNGNSYVAGHDDIDDDGNDWVLLSGSSVLESGVGYAATHSTTGFVGGNTYPYTFEGPLNTGTITTSIHYNGDNGDSDWNLIGNPYPSAIDVDAFFDANPTVIGSVIYLWTHATTPEANNNGNETYNFNSDDYAIINAGSGEIAGGSSVIPSRFIPSGQGFFVQGLENDDVIFTNSMRMADNSSNNSFFRQQNTLDANKLWLNLTTNNGAFNQLLIAYVDGATSADDGLYYDATRNLSTDAAAVIYSTISGHPDKKYAIQGKAVTDLTTEEVIPFGLYTSITEPTQYTFSIGKLQGDFLSTHTIYLKDLLLNTTHNLSAADYTFSSESGEFNSRFEIVFQEDTLGIPSNISQNMLRIMELSHNQLQFKMTNQQAIQSIELYNTLGQKVLTAMANETSTIVDIAHLGQASYIAKIGLQNGQTITKKVLRRL